jgi:CxxC-x17-CxxC domain-containing protein
MKDERKGGFGRDSGTREMHKATCSDCGSECEVPFKPVEGRPVYCRECFRKNKKF